MILQTQNIIIPDKNSLTNEWISYYKNLNQKFDKNDTQAIFLKTWTLSGDSSLKSDSNFVDFFKSKGIDLSSGAYDIKDTFRQAGETIFGMPEKILRIVSIPFITILIGVIGYSVFKIVKK